MSESPFRAALVERVGQRFFYGWVILAVATLGIFASGPAQSHTFSVFVGPIADALGLSQTEIAFAYGSATLVAAFCLPFMGRYLDRVGARRMLALVALLFGTACVAFGFVGSLIWLGLGFAAMRYLGQGSLMLGSSNLVSQWFSRRRGFALGLMALGFAASMAVHPAVAEWLIGAVGWREAWLWIGLSTWVLLLPVILLLAIGKPEEVGLTPDGGTAVASGRSSGAVLTAGVVADFTQGEALRSRAFYIVAGGLFTFSMLVTTLHFFQVSIFAAQNLDTGIATTSFAISAVCMVLMMPTFGRMLDRFPTERMFGGGLLILAITLISASQVSGLWSALIYAVAFGAANATSMTFFSFMWPRYFGRAHLGSIQGTGQMIGVVGASLGPLPLGLAQDYLGGYNAMLIGLAAIPLLWALVAVLFLRQPVKPEPVKDAIR